MSLIIDANRASDFQAPIQPHAAEIIKGVAQRKIRITVGGQLTRELSSTPIRRLLLEWGRVGALHRVDGAVVDGLQATIAGIKSDDPHVIALAMVSKTRLLYTDDQNLILDFKNIKILKPKGKVFQSKTSGKIARSLMNSFGG